MSKCPRIFVSRNEPHIDPRFAELPNIFTAAHRQRDTRNARCHGVSRAGQSGSPETSRVTGSPDVQLPRAACSRLCCWVLVAAALASSTLARADVRLVGNTFVHAWTINPYPEGTPAPKYETRFCDGQTLVWNDVTDLRDIRSGVETYELTEISPGVLQVTWKESADTTGHGVVWTLNFRTYAIYGVVVNADPDVNHVLAGGFSFRDGVRAEPPLRGCL